MKDDGYISKFKFKKGQPITFEEFDNETKKLNCRISGQIYQGYYSIVSQYSPSTPEVRLDFNYNNDHVNFKMDMRSEAYKNSIEIMLKLMINLYREKNPAGSPSSSIPTIEFNIAQGDTPFTMQQRKEYIQNTVKKYNLECRFTEKNVFLPSHQTFPSNPSNKPPVSPSASVTASNTDNDTSQYPIPPSPESDAEITQSNSSHFNRNKS
jgi:hypothetical protein